MRTKVQTLLKIKCKIITYKKDVLNILYAELNKIEIFDCTLQNKTTVSLISLFYLLSGNGNFREERKTKGEK